MSELAAIEQVHKGTMTRIVDSLERWGMVERWAAPKEDRRRTIVRPTFTGRVVMERGRANRVAELERRLDRLSEPDIALLARAAELIERISKRDAFTQGDRPSL